MKKILAGLLMVPCMAHAQYYTGNNLLQKMNSTETVDRMVAMGYVMGVSDVYQNTAHCSGQRVTSGQTRDVVKNYLEQNPAVRDLSADFLTMLALGLAFPCPKENNNKRRNGT
jgi:translation elongation factor EF-1alpha